MSTLQVSGISQIMGAQNNAGNFNAKCSISEHAKSDLRWWIAILFHTAAPIKRNSPDMVIYTDVSDYGWGTFFQGVQAQGKFPPEQADLCINSKETIAMYNGVASFEPFLMDLICSSGQTTLQL